MDIINFVFVEFDSNQKIEKEFDIGNYYESKFVDGGIYHPLQHYSKVWMFFLSRSVSWSFSSSTFSIAFLWSSKIFYLL